MPENLGDVSSTAALCNSQTNLGPGYEHNSGPGTAPGPLPAVQ